MSSRFTEMFFMAVEVSRLVGSFGTALRRWLLELELVAELLRGSLLSCWRSSLWRVWFITRLWVSVCCALPVLGFLGPLGRSKETARRDLRSRLHTAGSHVKSARVKSPPSQGGGSLRFKKARIRLGSH